MTPRQALEKIIEMNRQTAQDKYGDPEKAERWSCVTVAREGLASTDCCHGHEKRGARDVYWCYFINEPVITSYAMKSNTPLCDHCEGEMVPELHRFLFHIEKP